MDLRTYILGLLLNHVPPGQTVYSLERMPDCGTDPSVPACELRPVCSTASVVCAPPRWAPTLGSWVRYESPEAAKARYGDAVDAVLEVGAELLCVGAVWEGEDCVPIRWGWDKVAKRNTGTLRSLALLSFAVGIPESGLREDVQTGRGRSRRDHRGMVDGGEGRGPGNEAGYWQAHPTIAWRFMGLESRPDREGLYLASLVGEGVEPVKRAARVALLMLAHSRDYCRLAPPSPIERQYAWAWAAISYYGTGSSCDSYNEGKTEYRYRLFVKFMEGNMTPEPPMPKVEHRRTPGKPGRPPLVIVPSVP